MSDSERTEYQQSWEEDRTGERQPDEGRAAADLDQQQGEAGAGTDAGGTASQAEAPSSDADLPPAEDENSDEFAGLSEADLRERAKALAAEVAAERAARSQAENTLRSNEGRYSRSERELNELRGRLQAKPQAETKAQGPIISEDELARIETEYDDLGPVFSNTVRALNARIEELQQDRSKNAERFELERQRDHQQFVDQQVALLTDRHSDWMVVKDKPEYGAWYLSQPDWVKDLVARNGKELVDAEAAAAVFDKFKADTKPAADPHEERRQRQLAGSADIPTKAPAFEASKATGAGGDYKTEWEAAKREEQQERDRQARRAR